MAYDEDLAGRVRRALAGRGVHADEKRMMGGLCFMVDAKMCVGIVEERLMLRLDPAEYEEAITRPGCVPMDFTGRPMRGFVFVTLAVKGAGMGTEAELEFWLGRALEFNPRAKASKKKGRR